MKKTRALKLHYVEQFMFLFYSNIYIYTLIQVKKTTVFLCGNFELKHVTIVTDLRCFEKLGPALIFIRVVYE